MNAYERVMNTLQGRPADRVPVFAVLGARGGPLTGTDLRTLYGQADAWVAGQRAVQDTFGLDAVLATFDYSALSEAFGGETAWFDDQPPNMKRPGFATAQRALDAPLPDPWTSGRLPMILDATRRLAGIYQGTVPVLAALPGPCNLPALVMGLDGWMETLLFDPGRTLALLEHTGEFYVAWARALLDAGATALVVTEGMAAAEVLPRGIFSQQCLPHLRYIFQRVGGPWVIHQTGGSINHVADLLPGLPGLLGIAVGSKDDLGEARSKVGSVPLIGNLDNLGFPLASAGEIRAQGLDLLRTVAPAGPFILSNSGADLPIHTPAANIHALLDASLAFARGDA